MPRSAFIIVLAVVTFGVFLLLMPYLGHLPNAG
jgi:hypothetical protein